ncbi:MAG: hypothetical protein GXX09_00420 [Syntrophomonadaceae bacterium]|nr:hypothetical protein [Syntrophomonadaceae bacterium]
MLDNQDVSRAIGKIEVLAFFQKNPHTRDTLEGLARRLFLETELVAEVVKELLEVGILTKVGQGERAIYRLKASFGSVKDYQFSSPKGDISSGDLHFG